MNSETFRGENESSSNYNSLDRRRDREKRFKIRKRVLQGSRYFVQGSRFKIRKRAMVQGSRFKIQKVKG